jgi:hypothetical protein
MVTVAFFQILAYFFQYTHHVLYNWYWLWILDLYTHIIYLFAHLIGF